MPVLRRAPALSGKKTNSAYRHASPPSRSVISHGSGSRKNCIIRPSSPDDALSAIITSVQSVRHYVKVQLGRYERRV